MDNIIERARILRVTIEEMAQGLDDSTAESVPELFPEWNPEGCDYEPGDRVRAGGVLYKTISAHTSQPDWTPDVAVSLYARVLAGQEGTPIGVWEQPDSTNGYKKGNKVHYPTMDDPVYESLINNNVWSPEAYPQGWQEVTE